MVYHFTAFFEPRYKQSVYSSMYLGYITLTLGSAADKANYVLQRGLGGAMLWDLPQDDFSVSPSICWFLHLICLCKISSNYLLNNSFLRKRGMASTPKMEYQIIPKELSYGYSHLFNKHGGWNKRGGVCKSCQITKQNKRGG